MAVYDNQPGFAIHPLTSDAYQADIETVLNPLTQYRSVLELGCGSGAFTQFLVTQGVAVVGVDRNETQLIQARQRLLPRRSLNTTNRDAIQTIASPELMCYYPP